MQRRVFLAATVAGVGGLCADRLPISEIVVDDEAIGSLTATLSELRLLDGRDGSASVIMPAQWLAGRLSRALGNTPAQHSLHQSLAGLAADASELAGWASFETGDYPGALHWYDRSISAARDARDPDLAAFAGEYQARVLWLGMGETETALARLDRISLDGVSSQIRSHVHGGRARALAHAGRELASLHALDQATAAAADDGPAWAGWCGSTAHDDVGRGLTLVDLSHGAKAYALLKGSLRTMPSRLRRAAGTRHRALAQAAMQMGEPKQAASHVVSAHRLLTATQSRQLDTLQAVIDELQSRFGDVRPVRELGERLRTDTKYVLCRTSDQALRIHLRTCRYASRGGARPWPAGDRLDPAELAASPLSSGLDLCERCLQ